MEFDVLEDLGMDFMCWNGGICGGFSWAIWGLMIVEILAKEMEEFRFELFLKRLCNNEMDICSNLDVMQECQLHY